MKVVLLILIISFVTFVSLFTLFGIPDPIMKIMFQSDHYVEWFWEQVWEGIEKRETLEPQKPIDWLNVKITFFTSLIPSLFLAITTSTAYYFLLSADSPLKKNKASSR